MDARKLPAPLADAGRARGPRRRAPGNSHLDGRVETPVAQGERGKHVTLQLLHLEYKAIYPEGWGYTQFCAHYRRWLARQDVVMRLEYAAGERMFVDFGGDTVPVTDPQTGEVWDAQICYLRWRDRGRE